MTSPYLRIQPGVVLEFVRCVPDPYKVGDLIYVTHTCNQMGSSMHGILRRNGEEVPAAKDFKDPKFPGWDLLWFIDAVVQGNIIVKMPSVADKIDKIVASVLGEG